MFGCNFSIKEEEKKKAEEELKRMELEKKKMEEEKKKMEEERKKEQKEYEDCKKVVITIPRQECYKKKIKDVAGKIRSVSGIILVNQ